MSLVRKIFFWWDSQVMSLFLVRDVVLGLSINMSTQGLDQVQSSTVTWQGKFNNDLGKDIDR